MPHPIEIRNLRKSYEGRAAVDNLSFDLRAGTLLGLLGHNGAGKTTTIRIALGMIRSDGGTVSILGGPITRDTRDRIGYLPEERGLYPKMPVIDFLFFIGMLRGCERSAIRPRAANWLERFDLADRHKSPIQELSKGNQQKVQFIATLLHDPDILILDEPFSGLDPVNRHLFEEIVLEKRREGKAIIFSTHVLEQAERLLDEVIMLRKGVAVVQGKLSEVRASYGGSKLDIAGEGVEGALRGYPGVEPGRQPREGVWRFRIDDRSRAQEVLAHLVRSGARVEGFTLAEPSLNDIFLERVGGIDRGLVESGFIPEEAGA
ncbi:MAG: ATP-binding cassette domain-containing protein [Candidatus Sumerlaeia bacterium]|nr:ATP-binding cassette domain-containing protein [Candidatus Sumerlaeia bacterium]